MFDTTEPYPLTERSWENFVELLNLGGVTTQSDREVLKCLYVLEEMGLLELSTEKVDRGNIIKVKSKYNE